MQVAESRRRLFDISDDLQALEDLLYESGGDISDEEIEQALDQWFDTLGAERDQKLDNYAALITELEGRAALRKGESRRLAERAKVDENAAQRLKDRLVWFFQRHDLKTIETARYRLTRARAGGKQPITIKVDPEQLPPDLRRTDVRYSADRDKILAAIEAGQDVSEYAELAPRSEYMRIK